MNFQANSFHVEMSYSLDPVGILEMLSQVKWAVELNICEDKLAI